MNEPQKCVILVPVGSHIELACEQGLHELERRGYVVRRTPGYAAIDQARNQMATDALAAGFEETVWIDSDMAFDPDDVERLRAHGLPIACAIAAKKGQRCLACHALPGTAEFVFGAGGGLTELYYAGTGFLHVRRQVYLDIQQRLALPVCNQRFGRAVVPFFQPMIRDDGQGHWYLAEDFSFCERARQCGFQIWADTRIRVWHIGGYGYSWEDAGTPKQRYATYHYRISDGERASVDDLTLAEHESLRLLPEPCASHSGSNDK